ncbi:MAG TPA: alpha-D-ribose 1-methylphosphonate 5-triphosphate diphosphatase [Puia sp.]|jgi:alpha-D-ribose 1-methylphosphonate 5-triphosphate diphosphatase|nr:alpha-D-ribose 1-methylphosphonate 5-triphosphate diphosphatase [Puia sp.]
MNTWLIKNAKVITPDGVIDGGSVWVEDGDIREVGRMTEDAGWEGRGGETREEGLREVQILDADGAYVMPGIIDIHTDAMDAEIVPRTGADIPIAVAFNELERKMCACGITTVFHSLHLGYEHAEDLSRSKYSREEVFREVKRAASGPTLIHNKIHLRFEVCGVESYDQCLDLMRNGYVDLLSVMDHTPGQGQIRKEYYKKYLLMQGKSQDQMDQLLEERLSWPKVEGEMLQGMVDVAKELNIPVASHDDDTIAKVDEMIALGVDISEFPINMETAEYATRMGLYVAGGASNVLRGGSLSGNLDMTEAIRERVVGLLCSDYYPAAILHSIFKLHLEYGMPLNDAVNLATLHPAESVGLDVETGSLEHGKRADLVVVRLRGSLPVVAKVMVNGKWVMETNTK